MRYVSTRDTSKTFEFKDVFIKGLADDGGLFIPEKFKKYNENEVKDLIKLSYRDLHGTCRRQRQMCIRDR